MKRAAPLVAVLCGAAAGLLLLDLSLGTVLIGIGLVVVLGVLRELWLSERAHRSSERERREHLVREREFANARLRERGD